LLPASRKQQLALPLSFLFFLWIFMRLTGSSKARGQTPSVFELRVAPNGNPFRLQFPLGGNAGCVCMEQALLLAEIFIS